MKYFFLILLFAMVTTNSFSQVDTSAKAYKVGLSFYGGLGFGGNGIKQGFARGLGIKFHYHCHTFDSYISHITEYEADYVSGHDLTLTYDCTNFGLTYGLGAYSKHFSAACLAGIGQTNTMMIEKNRDPYLVPYTIYIHKNYSQTTACLGLQAAAHGRILGVSAKYYYNISDKLSTYTLLLGLEVTL